MGCRTRVLAALALVAVPALAQSPSTAPVVPPLSGRLGTPVQLFNGHDLTGWTWFPRPPRPNTTDPTTPAKLEDVWSVRDGVIHCVGRPIGYLRTDQSFGNHYRLVVEQRHVKKGNGGILTAITKDRIWPGLEIQGASGAIGDFWNQEKLRMATDPARHNAKDARNTKRIGPDNEKPIGEWDTVEIRIDGPTVAVVLNGNVQNVATDCQDLSGRIGLQSEGGEMEFRKIELTPIEAETPK